MPRVKRGVTTNRRHKKIFKLAKGYRGKRKNVFKLAKNAVMKAGTNAYRDRRLKKRTFHQLWILRINAACRANGMKYSRFMYGLELAGIQINRKMLSELATNHEEVFIKLIEEAKAVLPAQGQAPDLNEVAKRVGKTATTKKPAPKKTAPKAEAKKEAKATSIKAKTAKKEEKVEKKPATKKSTAKESEAKKEGK